MTMSAGSVSILVLPDFTSTISGSGMALTIANSFRAFIIDPQLITTRDQVAAADPPLDPPFTADKLQVMANFYVNLSTAIANGVVAHLAASAHAHIAVDAIASGVPAAAVDLPIQ